MTNLIFFTYNNWFIDNFIFLINVYDVTILLIIYYKISNRTYFKLLQWNHNNFKILEKNCEMHENIVKFTKMLKNVNEKCRKMQYNVL